MRPADAIALLAGGDFADPAPATWADLGCGDGTFTLALATLLPRGSTIHAMDRDEAAVRALPRLFGTTRIAPSVGDFTGVWPFAELDGILMANSLHYVPQAEPFILQCQARVKDRHRLAIVEYDMRQANPWVPYPLDSNTLTGILERVGYRSIARLGSRRSVYQRARIYSLLADTRAVRDR